jgi:hypothetical protein
MNQNIQEMAKALRDAADCIENASKFKLGNDIDFADAVTMIRMHMQRDAVTLMVHIDIPRKDNEPAEVAYSITEGYKETCRAGQLKACLDIYTSTKVANGTLAALAKISKPELSETGKADVPF